MVANTLSRSFPFAVLLVACLSSACGQDSPTAPTEIPQAQSAAAPDAASPTPAPAVGVPAQLGTPTGPAGVDTSHLCTQIQQGVSCQVIAFTDSRITVRFQNASSQTQTINLAIYKRAGKTFEDQQLDESASALEQLLEAGQARTLEADLPSCSVQIDEHVGLKVTHPPHADGTLLGYAVTAGAFCGEAPPTDPKPPVDVCPNLPGAQSTMPAGYQDDGHGNCVKVQPPSVDPPPPAPVCPDFTALLASHDKAAVLKYLSPFNVHSSSETEACADIVVHDLPPGCTLPLSLGSYQRYNQQIKFPQKFIANSDGEFGNGTYACAIPVKKQIGCYQVDLRFGQTQAEDLTQANESGDYGWRTLDWITNSAQHATCPPIAVE